MDRKDFDKIDLETKGELIFSKGEFVANHEYYRKESLLRI